MSNVKTNSAKAWILAARPKTLTGASIPVMMGTALASADGCFKWQPALLCFLFAFLMQIAANFINDYFDFRKGTDREDRLGPERACAQGWITPGAMMKGVLITIASACAIGLFLLCWGGWELIIIGVLCVVFAFLYTTLLSYLGLGDLLVFAFFGFVPVLGTYYVQGATISTSGIVCSLASGLVIDLLLIINNYRDRETDKRSGKKTLISILGGTFGERQYLITGLLAWLCCSWFILQQQPWVIILASLFLPLHITTWKEMKHIHQGKALNSILAKTSRNMFIFGLLVSLGLLL